MQKIVLKLILLCLGFAIAIWLNFFNHCNNFLSEHTSRTTNFFLKITNFPSAGISKTNELWTLLINENPVLVVTDSCNALEIYMLNFIFLYLYGGKKYLIHFLIILGPGIFFLNTMRIFALFHLAIYYPATLDFHHHYTFTVVVYSLVLLAWYKWAKINSHARI